MTVMYSTISGNAADGARGGGIHGGNVTVVSSTIAENSADDDGGGIFADGIVTATSSIIAGNSASGAGGGISSIAQLSLENSIVARNTARRGDPDLQHDIGSLSVHYSLLGDNSGTNWAEAPLGSPDDHGNLVGGPTHGTIDPQLSPLGDHGGLTFTYALLPTSPAIDAGDPAAMAWRRRRARL